MLREENQKARLSKDADVIYQFLFDLRHKGANHSLKFLPKSHFLVKVAFLLLTETHFFFFSYFQIVPLDYTCPHIYFLLI